MKMFLAACVCLLVSCAGAPTISRSRAVQDYVDQQMASLDFRADDDRELIRESLIGFIGARIDRHGPGFFENLEKLESIKGLKDMMVERYGTTAADAGMTNNILYAREGGDEPIPFLLNPWPRFERYETEVFIVYVQKGTIPEKNADRILRILGE